MSSPITASYVVATHHLSRSHRDTSQKTNFDGYHINYARKYMREYAPQITAELGLKPTREHEVVQRTTTDPSRLERANWL